MACDDNWSNLPHELLFLIVQKLSVLRDCFRVTLVCKSWRNSLSGYDKPCLPLTGYPFLLLAEKVAPGAIVCDGDYDSNEDYGDTDDEEEEHSDNDEDAEEEENDDDDDNEDDDDTTDDEKEEEHSGKDDYEGDCDKEDQIEEDDDDDDDEDQEQRYDHSKKSVGSSRGLYSLLTRNTYVIDLPEAAGRLIVGTNIGGWLVTLGTDLQINLLHPLLRQQIQLPSMLTFPQQGNYNEQYKPEDASEIFVEKIAISSKILNKKTAVGLYNHHATPSPIVMALYGGLGALGFARVGDEVWTDVNIPSCAFQDIVYHNGKFYVVDPHGGVFVCGVDDDIDGGGLRGMEIAKLYKTNNWDQKYLVESSSGSGLLLLVRYRKTKFLKSAHRRRAKYRTTGFSVWRLDLKSSDSTENISCNLIEENDLSNEAIFVGRNSSVSISSSDFIKPNSIYFTDDYLEAYLRDGGGHDMGIFDMKSRTIEPHYSGKSIHPISPPLWYI